MAQKWQSLNLQSKFNANSKFKILISKQYQMTKILISKYLENLEFWVYLGFRD